MLFSKALNVGYAPVPKIACTSIKEYFFYIQNKFTFQVFDVGKKHFHIHNLAPTKEYAAWRDELAKHLHSNPFMFAVVREPIARFVSCYSNRILYHDDISKNAKVSEVISEAGLPTRPDINTFASNLEFYSMHAGSVRHHTLPIVEFLGRDRDTFSKIYPISEVNTSLLSDLSDWTGLELQSIAHRKQAGGPKLKKDELSRENILKLKAYYAEDYKIFGDYFN